jgi:Holliday junction DNA helicase RuvA
VIAHLSGTLLEKHLQRLVVDVSGVGYDVLVPLSTFYTVGEPGAAVALRIHTHVREDAIQLFGFSTSLEQVLFEKLIATSGVGPKLALAVLSGIESTDLVRAVRQADVARLTRIPGVGRKTAERLVVELKDRLPNDAAVPAGPASPSAASSTRDDVVSALVNLGYQRGQVDRAVDAAVRAAGEDADFERILREALRSMTNGAAKA